MADKEMYDYLSSVTPDSTAAALVLKPNNIVTEKGRKNTVIHEFDDESEERIAISNQSVFYVNLMWKAQTSSDAGIIFDYFHSTAIGNGMARSFKWTHPNDGHTYVARFASELPRSIDMNNYHSLQNIQLKILGTT